MRDSQGWIVEYAREDGSKQKAIMRYNEQTPNYSNYKRVFLRLIDDDGNFVTDESGKKVIAVLHVSEISRIGFVD